MACMPRPAALWRGCNAGRRRSTMMRNLILLLSCLVPLAQAATTPVTWSLAGQWQVHDANDGTTSSIAGWRALRVPANWYSAGYDHQGALMYRHAFTLPEQPADTMATLVFDGA